MQYKNFIYLPFTITNYSLEGVSSINASLGIKEIFNTLAELKVLPPATLFVHHQIAKFKLAIKESNNKYINFFCKQPGS
ncbi:hypothetical protein GCM10028895_05070 [Pontibacter rugosus]